MQIDLETLDFVTKKEGKRYLFDNEIAGGVGEKITKIIISIPNEKEEIDKAIKALETYKMML